MVHAVFVYALQGVCDLCKELSNMLIVHDSDTQRYSRQLRMLSLVRQDLPRSS